MKSKQSKSTPVAPQSDLDEATDVRKQAYADLGECDFEDKPKFYDAYARASNIERQLKKDRKRALTEFTDDEVIAYIRSLPERRREALLVAVQGTSLAGKPLF